MNGKESILDNGRFIQGHSSSSSSDDSHHEASSSTSSTSLTTTETMDPLYTPTTFTGVKTEVPILPTSVPPSTIFKKDYLTGEKRHREENEDLGKIISTSNSISNSDIEFYPPTVKRRSTSTSISHSPKTRSYSVGMFPPLSSRKNSITSNINMMNTTDNNLHGNNAPKVLKKDKRKSAHTPYDARYWSKRNSQVKSSFDEEAPPSWREPSLSSTHEELFETSNTLSNMLLGDFDYLARYVRRGSNSTSGSVESGSPSDHHEFIMGNSDRHNSVSISPFASEKSLNQQLQEQFSALANNANGNDGPGSRRRKLGDEIHWKPTSAGVLWELHKVFHLDQRKVVRLLGAKSKGNSCFGLLNLRELGAWERGDSQQTLSKRRR
ncbi:unnamed protein product [Ambrosiozyma monospora]|uniref:Unnamed protein product n=1 Tax=Ambrosiozyma monospora TaxID=43982 RepID=A0ACB5T454_AMBMO|nr:unnamed protein product [Ambrosiozyma monospora]